MYTCYFAPWRKTIVVGAITTALLLLALLSGGTVQAQAQNLAPAAAQVMAAGPLINIQSIVGGGGHTCALLNGGGVNCWGYNANGQLGDGTQIDRLIPADVTGLNSGVQAVAAGGLHTCALTTGGGVKCWGLNLSGRLGDGTTVTRLTPVDVNGLTNGVQAIAAGWEHTCALTTGGGVKCWGDNKAGQLGDGTQSDRVTPVDVFTLASGVRAITAAAFHTCALLNSGGVKCWGGNASGQLGDGSTTDHFTPIAVSGLSSDVQSVTAGNLHTCALMAGGGLKCWGENTDGQLGDGTTTDRLTPVNVNNPPGGVQAVSAGWEHTCALTNNGGVKCWGDNAFAQLGDGTTTSRATPTDVSGLTGGIQRVAAGRLHTCAITNGGSARCWGYNASGQLGNGKTDDLWTPVDVSGLTSGVQAVAAGGGHTCALTTGGGVQCWGDNSNGQLGDGATTNRSTPADVSGLTSGVQIIATGGIHTCALTTSGGVKCWGRNQYGQLGDGTMTNRLVPVDVIGLTSDVQAITAGTNHTCALTKSGGVKCWGVNTSGELGDGTWTSRLTPVDVNGLSSGVQAITAGWSHTCAVPTGGGGVKCWGGNDYGQLGDGTTTTRNTPANVSGLTGGVQMVEAGEEHTCAVSADALKCWGRNHVGQLGNGTTANHSAPVQVVGMERNAQMVAAARVHTCGLTTGNGLKCWGSNLAGQLGDGTTTSRLIPMDVSGLTSGVQMVSTGIAHTCALTTGGGVKCWGESISGQAGVSPPLTPVDVISDQAAASGLYLPLINK